MISHPFEIKPSVADDTPDVLMVTWRGTPSQSVAEIYLPAVSSQAIVALADKLYGRHRIVAIDPNTIQFPATDLTLIPIPAGTGRYAGLLSVDARPSLPVGQTFVVSVRQLNFVSVTANTRTPPPPPQARKRAAAAAVAETATNETLAWRQVKGAFQYSVSVKSDQVVLAEQELLVGWLKWRISITPATNRWLPVLERYLKYTETLVWTLGKDPNTIPPSEIGRVIDQGPGPWLPITGGRERECTGKVCAIFYDRFGDFRGFKIRTESGDERSYRSTETAVEELVRDAWVERTLLRVVSHEHDPEYPDQLILLRHH